MAKTIKFYNTLGKTLEKFKPLRSKEVAFYYCGPTVYSTQHIGNLRGMTCVDLIVRSMQYLGYKVKLVRNYTDVGHLVSDGDEGEDKMEKGSKREGLTPVQIADKYIKIYEEDTKALNLIEPEIKCRATDHVAEMIEMTKTLLDKGFAYATPLAIYFDIDKFEDYGKLSGRKRETNIAGAGSGEVEDGNKKNPDDFALWFFRAGKHEKAIQYWPSPFSSPLAESGNGFPGWHIECSAMSKKYLGETIDIHMGGIEHVTVHHTNEIAQSEAASGKIFANYWLHNEHLLVNGGKMSKSDGTGYTLSDVMEKGFGPLDLRYFYLSAHYRSKQNFTWEALGAAKSGREHLYNQVRELGGEAGRINKHFKVSFEDRLAEDINIPQAMAVVQELLKSDIANEDKLATVLDFDRVLGLDLNKAIEATELPDEIKELVAQRDQARVEKNWAESDRLRTELEAHGYIVEDTKNGTRVRRV